LRELLMIGGACVGVGLTVNGVAMWSVPAAWIVSGLTLTLVALWPFLRLRLR
jgi:hypothetical protein